LQDRAGKLFSTWFYSNENAENTGIRVNFSIDQW